MKRIFISVGTAGLRALSELIDRLRMENVFDSFNDYYIAFDSDQLYVDKFNSLARRLRSPRIKGYLAVSDDQDFKATCAFRPSWTRPIPAGGVGGDRTICSKAISCIKKVWMNSDLCLDEDLQQDDQIIVVGSAFGGTSSGMFLNVCEYLDLVIRNKREVKDEYKNVQVLGFLLMPEEEFCNSDHDSGYPLSLNMIDLFTDLETISWQRRLESARPGFKVPTLAHYKYGFYPFFTKTRENGDLSLHEYGICGSSLPVSTLYLVPTPTGYRHLSSSLYAECLFVATYLQVDMGHFAWVDRIYGQSVPNDLTKVDRCFAGFNMFAMRSGRMLSLKNWFCKGLASAYANLMSERENNTVRDNIVRFFKGVQTPCLFKPYAGVKHKKLEELTKDYFMDPNNFREFAESLKGFLEELYLNANPIEGISPHGLVAILGSLDSESAWLSQVNFSSIKNAYSEYYSFLETEMQKNHEYEEVIEKTVQESCALMAYRTKHIFGFGKWKQNRVNAVRTKIIDAFMPKLKDLLDKYCFACRIQKTFFFEPADFNTAVDTIDHYMAQIVGRIKDEFVKRTENNPFMKEGILVDPLILPAEEAAKVDFNPLKILVSAAFRSECKISEQENAVVMGKIVDMKNTNHFLATQPTPGNIIVEAEEIAISSFDNAVKELPPESNPLKAATISNFDAFTAKTFSPVFSVPDSGAFHYHFSINLNVPPYFRLSNGDVAGGSGLPSLGLSTMPNVANPTEPFLTTDHSRTEDMFSWKDEKTEQTPIPQVIKENIQGLWIGTLSIDNYLKNILDRLYSHDNKRKWIDAMMNEDLHPRSLMSTVEMLQFGTLIEAIETKVQEKWRQYAQEHSDKPPRIRSFGAPVTVSFRKRVFLSRQLPSNTLRELGFEDDKDNAGFGCHMSRISLEWTKEILDWIRTPGEKGFENFYPVEFFNTRRTRRNVLIDSKFCILPGEIEDMDELKHLILDSMTIEGLE